MRLRLATGDGTDAVVALYDEAVAWLAARGRADQWGTTPFSARPEVVALIRERAGPMLLKHARATARRVGIGLLRLDCYAGGDGGLVRYYESAGFHQVTRFTVELMGATYVGCLLEQRLTPYPTRHALRVAGIGHGRSVVFRTGERYNGDGGSISGGWSWLVVGWMR